MSSYLIEAYDSILDLQDGVLDVVANEVVQPCGRGLTS